ncbi:MAG: FAD-dependent oxidoreductase [candidate division Zixibacteria bacterium]|nr:FAD-dependent oxidoreductase [candidate division Zixibacteria bacterium]
MKKLSTIDEFVDFRRRILSEKEIQFDKPTLVVCAGTGGQASGANDIIRVIKRYILDHGLVEKIGFRVTGCQGFCEMDPFILVQPGRHLYPKLKMEDVPKVIKSALEGYVDEDLIYKDPRELKSYHYQNDIPFFKKQTRTLLGNNEKLDPIRILNYIELGGYGALEKVLAKIDPEWIISEVKKSGLRGRGGAGFLAGLKWQLARAAGKPGEQKYVVCNADEGDPGAYMDRSLLEGNPHAIIEGMIIDGIAIGATKGFIYVRSEYPLAIKHSLIALGQCCDLGILGKNILETGVDFDIEIVRGAGAFVCGEETALIKSVMGLMGEPRQRPPYPIEKGIWGHPTCINNVETLANIPVIISQGADEFLKVGVPGNSGTKIFSLVGKIKNTGLVEVPLGIKISEVVNEIGGGPVGEAKIKAVQTGGPSGGCIPASMFDLSIDYDSLAQAGTIMGSGGMIVMDENTCMIDVARYFMSFLKDESCGKCFTCRKGTQRMFEILDDISKGKGTLEQMSLLEELANVVKDTTMCGLGQTASNPVLSTLRYFRDEYLEHIVHKHCSAGVCKELVGAPCQTTCPLGTEAWRYVAHIARGEYEDAYQVIREANPFPSVCARVCNHPCESKCKAGTSGGQSVAIRALKRFVTDRVDPSIYEPVRLAEASADSPRIAIIGAGPAGLTAAHYLSLRGYKSTVFDSERKPGGMMFSAIPAYRLPREVIEKEIESLIDDNITMKYDTALGRDINIDGLFAEGYKAVFLALGAHMSKPLEIEGENAEGVYPSVQFLRSFNVMGKKMAKGSVGIIGGGNSAVDAARVAVRQEGVNNVTIFYRRTRKEMPAYEEEVEAAIQEGINLEALVTPVKVLSTNGHLTGLQCRRNKLGDADASGRRRPVEIPGSEFIVPLDTLVVAISEASDIDCISVASSMKIDTDLKSGTVKVDFESLSTNRPGVFAGGDLTTGPNTIVDAIAAGKKVAVMIDRYVRGEELKQPAAVRLPRIYIEPVKVAEEMMAEAKRVETPRAGVQWRKRGFAEVEMSLTLEEAAREACRCLRCDLDFTRPKETEKKEVEVRG